MQPTVSSTAEIERVSEQLRDFYVRAQRGMNQIMRDNGASYARTKMLVFIDREGPVRSIDLADAFGHAPRTVTVAIDSLERDGLIRREPDLVDRRAKRLSITEAGKTAIKTSEPSRRAFLAEVFGVLDAQENAVFSAVLDRLNDRLDALERARARTVDQPPA